LFKLKMKMKNTIWIYFILFSGVVLVSVYNCKKEKTIKIAPVVTIAAVTNITSNSATSGGVITEDGGTAVTARGVCWCTSQEPTVLNDKTTDGTGSGSFTSAINGLIPGETYNLKAYAVNDAGTTYSDQLTFTTLGNLANLTTIDLSSKTPSSAMSGGNIIDDGGAPITARGVCWNTSQNPTITNSKTLDGTGAGIFTSNITGLTANTTYYVRAYATNSGGTAYGSEISFKTYLSTVSDIDGNVYNTVAIGSQTWLVENLKTTKFNDGTAIPLVSDNTAWSQLTASGYCWYDNNDLQYKFTYGALYNGYTVITGKLCPTGWHVPTDDDWTILTTYLGGGSVAGNKLKESGIMHWQSPNTGATNESGFTAFGGGRRFGSGAFNLLTVEGYWWSSSQYMTSTALWYRYMSYNQSYIGYTGLDNTNGNSVRCIKD
jgi:uncharacterized protein (TIGR02145 family)